MRFVQIFALSITNMTGSNNNDNGWCFINELISKHKILIDLMFPVIVCVLIVTLFVISKCERNIIITYCSKRQINFKNTFISMILLLIGNALSVLL